MKLLIVDDSKMILKHAENILKDNKVGTEIFISKSGNEAFEILNNEDIDIVILDIVMPKFSGIEVLRIIKNKKELMDIKVLMFTSLVDKTALQECFELGATDYIMKPLEEVEFISRIKAAIKEKEMGKEICNYVNQLKNQNEQLVELNEQLKVTQLQLFQQEKLAGIGHLAAGVAHEMNNPLGFITSNFTILQKYCKKYKLLFDLYHNYQNNLDKHEKDDVSRSLKAILDYEKQSDFMFMQEDINLLFDDTFEGLGRVNKIVSGLRMFSRVDKVEEFENYDLNEGIENTLVIARNEIKYNANIELELEKIPNIDAVGGQVNQVVLNMLLNSASAIKEKHGDKLGCIKIRTFTKESNVFFAIKDNGIGMREEDERSIFNPFFTTKPVGEGTGLGLSISYDIIINKHGGTIDTKSIYGEGTEITVRLPIKSEILKEKMVDDGFTGG